MPLVDATAVLDEERGEVTIFCVNRSLEASVDVRVGVRGMGDCRVLGASVLTDEDPTA